MKTAKKSLEMSTVRTLIPILFTSGRSKGVEEVQAINNHDGTYLLLGVTWYAKGVHFADIVRKEEGKTFVDPRSGVVLRNGYSTLRIAVKNGDGAERLYDKLRDWWRGFRLSYGETGSLNAALIIPPGFDRQQLFRVLRKFERDGQIEWELDEAKPLSEK